MYQSIELTLRIHLEVHLKLVSSIQYSSITAARKFKKYQVRIDNTNILIITKDTMIE